MARNTPNVQPEFAAWLRNDSRSAAHLLMGAGVLPFALRDRRVWFLMQTVFSGRKRGFLKDFGGGIEHGESEIRAAAREFVEETETLYLSPDPAKAQRTPIAVATQLVTAKALFEATLTVHPDWWCRRVSPGSQKPKHWKTFFIQFPYRDVEALNRLWESDLSGRYKKRRELHWLSAEGLIDIYARCPERLWKRVRQLEGAVDLIDAIRRSSAS